MLLKDYITGRLPLQKSTVYYTNIKYMVSETLSCLVIDYIKISYPQWRTSPFLACCSNILLHRSIKRYGSSVLTIEVKLLHSSYCDKNPFKQCNLLLDFVTHESYKLSDYCILCFRCDSNRVQIRPNRLRKIDFGWMSAIIYWVED